MRKVRIRYLEQLGQIKEINEISDKVFILYTNNGVFYVRSIDRGYDVFCTEKVFERLKSNC